MEEKIMKRFGMKMMAGLMICFVLAGCGELRFAPGEAMKANAWAHFRTTQLAADAAQREGASEPLCGLTALSAKQSEAFVAYCGMPKELPAADTAEQALTETNQQLAKSAMEEASRRPDPWEAADGLLELGIAAASVLGGAAGLRIARAMQQAREKSKALREIIAGNELFKRNHYESAEAFKQAHQSQSAETRKLVAELKLQ
jgi:hypothetical protein